ncbi:unnamed protein product [Ambrosiozyma monospora]|uniref:Unnamed protein product n=1 Tax=Ambrosiozyma monospora TaxID=43982 RepID=A0ACB5T7I0_AMBMO|nr:unnamed protein product [Ambrosiozyma monospora]
MEEKGKFFNELKKDRITETGGLVASQSTVRATGRILEGPPTDPKAHVMMMHHRPYDYCCDSTDIPDPALYFSLFALHILLPDSMLGIMINHLM